MKRMVLNMSVQLAVLQAVQAKVEGQLLKDLESTKVFTGHSLVMRTLDDVKRDVTEYALNELDECSRRSIVWTYRV